LYTETLPYFFLADRDLALPNRCWWGWSCLQDWLTMLV